MLVTPLQIQLKLFQRRYNVNLSNLTDTALIFKVRTTNPNAFIVQPNLGFLRSQSNLSLLITIKSRNPFTQKMQISYANIVDPTMGYEEIWNNLIKNGTEIKNQIVVLSLKNQQEVGQEGQNIQMRKSRKSGVKKLAGRKEGSGRGSGLGLSIINQETEFKEFIASTVKINTSAKQQILQHYQREKRRHYQQQQRQQILYRIEQLQRKYNDEINQSERLKQKLEIAQSKIKQSSSQVLKYQIDQTLGTVCDQHHTSFTGLALIALIAFFLGYLYALFF